MHHTASRRSYLSKKILSFQQRKLDIWKGNVGFIVWGNALIAILIIELVLDTHIETKIHVLLTNKFYLEAARYEVSLG